MNHIVIAIDGPAASGKSSVGKMLAHQLGFVFVNSGFLYRAITLCIDQLQPSYPEAECILSHIRSLDLGLQVSGMDAKIVAEGREIQPAELRSVKVNARVASVAVIPEVREWITQELRALAADYNCVIEGRDIGSIVFPDTPYKIYLNASLDIRMARRSAQGEVDCVRTRDRSDISRSLSPLTITEDAMVIDVGNKTIAEVLKIAITGYNEKLNLYNNLYLTHKTL